jgi:D-alanyl-D-alanine carboxypeptidase
MQPLSIAPLFFVLFINLITPNWIGAQPIDRKTLLESIDSIAEEAIKSGPVAGLSLAIMHKGEVILAKGYGYADLENDLPTTAETVYGIRSISKNFTAALILKLVEDRKLELDDPISKYLPDLPTLWQPITVRQLLSHTSGIRNYGGERWRKNYRLGLSPEEWLALYRDDPLDFPPGSNYSYSNTGYLLLQLLIEKVSGQTYDVAVRNRIGVPLGLSSLTIIDDQPVIKRRVRAYEIKNGKLVNAVSWGGRGTAAGGLGATAIDLVRYQQGLEEGRLIPVSLLETMRSPFRIAEGQDIHYGLGTRLGELSGRRLSGHTGSGGGGTAALAYYPEDRLTIAVLTNTEEYKRHASIIQARIAKKILNLQTTEANLSEAEKKLYLGGWSLGKVSLRIFEQNGTIFGHPAGKPTPDQLIYQGRGRFILKDMPETEIRFFVENGQATRGVLYEAGFFTEVLKRQ